MYHDHFGMHGDPFALGPNLRFLYRSRSHAETMAHLSYGLDQGEDFVLIIGVIGSGKTLALQHLMAKASRLFLKVQINVTSVDFTEFLKLVLHELGQSWSPEADRADLLCLLKDRALAIHEEGQKILLVIDEAQNLDAATLEGIRQLTNLGQPDKQLFQIVLSGQPPLEMLIDCPQLAQLRQRIRIHYHLEPLTEKETGEYITHRLAVAGRREPLFTRAAISRIHEMSRGIPRLVNHLAGGALLAAFVDGAKRVDAGHVAAEGMPEPPPLLGGPAVPEETPGTIQDHPAVEPPPRRQADSARRKMGWAWAGLILLPLIVLGSIYLTREGPLVERTVRVEDAAPAEPTVPADRPVATVARPDRGDPAVADETPVAGPDLPQSASLPDPAMPGSEDAPPPPVIAPETAPAAPAGVRAPTRTDVPAGYWLHVASFKEQERADRQSQQLADAGYPVWVREVFLNGEFWLRVMVGPFADGASAEHAAIALRQRRLITFHRVMSY